MQLDREGIDDSSPTGVVDLKEHFLSNGLSNDAYNKLSKGIDNGGMNVDILCNCDENELQMIAKDCKLTYLQQKAFVEAVTLLKIVNASTSNNNESKKNNGCNMYSNNNNNNENNDKHQGEFKFIFGSPRDQNILNEMKEARDKLRQFSNYNSKMKEENVFELSLFIEKLKTYGDKLKEPIDNIVNNLTKHVKFLFILVGSGALSCLIVNKTV